MAQWRLSNTSSVPYWKVPWEAHFTITTNCVKQWWQLIGRKLLLGTTDTFDCIHSTLQLLSFLKTESMSEFACTMAQSIKTEDSFAHGNRLSRPLPPIWKHNHDFTFSFLSAVGPSESVGSSGFGTDELSHNSRIIDTCYILPCQRAPSQPVMKEVDASETRGI